jgi:hypothetical protein
MLVEIKCKCGKLVSTDSADRPAKVVHKPAGMR